MSELSRQDAEDLLYREARLLDERRLEEWLELFTADGMYWVPIEDDVDPELEPAMQYDDAEQRAMRVYQILHLPHYAQLPPSRTVHVVSNVEVENAAAGDEATVRCSLVVYELRSGDHLQLGLGEQRTLAARCEYRLRREEGWRIALKKVMLIDRELPIHNLSFLL
jgi:3-phenylpropionate/cinnamic acid dioxygenase small subunit